MAFLISPHPSRVSLSFALYCVHSMALRDLCSLTYSPRGALISRDMADSPFNLIISSCPSCLSCLSLAPKRASGVALRAIAVFVLGTRTGGSRATAAVTPRQFAQCARDKRLLPSLYLELRYDVPDNAAGEVTMDSCQVPRYACHAHVRWLDG